MRRAAQGTTVFLAFLLTFGGLVALVATWRFERPPGAAAHAQETGGCSTANIAGSYGYSLTGTLFLGDNGSPEPNGATRLDVVEIGVVVFDGQGGLSIGNDTLTRNGQVVQRTGSGTYTVSSDCTGTAAVTFSTGQTTHQAFVLVNGGKESRFMLTDPGTDIVGMSKRQ